MDENNQKYSLDSDSLTLLSLLGELYFPLASSEHPSTRGLILCVDSPSPGDTWIRTLRQLSDVTEIPSLRRENFSVPNFHLAVHFLRKYDSLETVDHFLGQTSFQPLVVCNGLIPDELVELADTISLPLDSLPNDALCFSELRECKQFYRKSPNQLSVALTQAETSDNFLQLQDSGSSSMLLERLLLVSELYLFWFRSQYNETETTNRRSILLSHLNELINTRINSDTTIDIADTFIRIFYNYLNCHTDIAYGPCDRLEGCTNVGLETRQTILWDQENYFISESLLKTICTPLLESIGWQKILSNLTREGIISVSSNQAGYTRKKTVINAFGQIKRENFIYLNKNALLSNDYIVPEERS